MGKRYLHAPLVDHLKTLRQMVFLTGPRQVGKTTLAKSMLREVLPGVNYFNWDVAAHRKTLLTRVFLGKEDLRGENRKIIVFDEIHKYPRWKNSLKGLFDEYEPENAHWIVTGSALLNVYRRGQDSLLGRHFTYHLAPFSVAELTRASGGGVPNFDLLLNVDFSPAGRENHEAFENLLRLGGFPEPLFKGEESFLSRWRSTRLDRLINQDLAATESLKNLPLVENLMFLLPGRVGNPLSLNSLREDLEVHFATVKHWMELLERVFYGFFIRPYSKKAGRMLRKEPKWYLWDWTEIEDPGSRFENLVAVHLQKYVNCLNQLGRGDLSLHYIRDKEKQEVDFLLCDRRKPRLLIECKVASAEAAPSLFHFAGLLGVKEVIQVSQERRDVRSYAGDGVRVRLLDAASFLKELA